MATTKSPPTAVLITIKEINRKLKKDGTTPMWHIVTDSGDFFSVFKSDIEARLELGKANAVMVEESVVGGKTYRNIVGIADPFAEPQGVDIESLLPTAQTPAKTPAAAHEKLTVVNNMVDVRAQALGAACTLAAGGVIPVSKIESQSNTFVNYLLHGKDVEHKNDSTGGSDGAEYIDGE